MVSFLKKFLSKPRVLPVSLITSSVVLLALVTLYFNFMLSRSLPALEKELSAYWGSEVSIEKANYLPFNRIIFRGISSDSADQDMDLSVQKISAVFSLKELILKRSFSFSGIVAENPVILFSSDGFKSKEFFLEKKAENTGKINPLKIELRRAVLAFPLKDEKFLKLKVNGEALLSRSNAMDVSCSFVWVKGTASEKFPGREQAGQCRFSLERHQNTVVFKNFEIKGTDIYAKLWGDLERSDLKLNGIVSSDTGLWEMNAPGKNSFLNDKIRDLPFPRDNNSPQILSGRKGGLNIYDLDSHFRFSREKIELISAGFSLNGVPLGLRGEFYFKEDPSFSFFCLTYPDMQTDLRNSFPGKCDIDLKGFLSEGVFKGDLKVDFLRKEKESCLPQSIVLNCEQALSLFAADNRLRLKCNSVKTGYYDRQNSYQALLEDMTAVLELSKTSGIIFSLSSSLYGGSMEVRGNLDFNRPVPQCSANLTMSDLDASLVSPLIPGFTFTSGYLQANLDLSSDPALVTGEVKIERGRIRDVEFLRWLSGFVKIPSLSELDFSSLYLHFLSDEQGSGIDKIALDSDQLTLKGNFYLYTSQLVSGKVSLGFSRGILELSPKFRSLCKLLGPGSSSVDFDFKLSGLCDAMNFKWLSSDFKQNLQDILPRSMEKSMEKKIEAVIRSISAK